jgi:outer membrane protein OmpA-like peptidoglycan-associated protein
VKAYLVAQGLSPDQLKTVSYGESKDRLVEQAGGRDRGMLNRRVVFVIESAAASVTN